MTDPHDHWTWRWIVDPPAQFGDNLPFDIVRLFVVLLTIILTLATGRVLKEQRRRAEPFEPGQAARFVSLLLLLWFVGLTELAVFGTPASPRLFVAIGAVTTGLWGVYKARAKQRRTPVMSRPTRAGRAAHHPQQHPPSPAPALPDQQEPPAAQKPPSPGP